MLAQLQTEPTGLTWNEARRRLKHFGLNETASQQPPSLLRLTWRAGKTPFNAILIALGIVSLLTRDLKAVTVMSVMVLLSTGL
ncbi:cation-transporting P-type ATPase, partial [Acinetobacter baumannii]